MKPENMKEFFEARLDIYEEHMLNEVEGCRGGYAAMAAALPDKARFILDLGAGTGLELVPILERFPDLVVNAIDFSGKMLARLRERFPNKHNLCAVAGDYTKVGLGIPYYDAVITFQSLHHLVPEERLALYEKIHGALKKDGVYVEGDYTACNDAEEEAMRKAAESARREYDIPDSEAVHLDIPLTAAHTEKLLLAAGFSEVKVIYTEGATTVLVATP